MRRRAFPDTLAVLCLAVVIVAGAIALMQESGRDDVGILLEGIDDTLAQIRTDFAAERDYHALSIAYDDRRKNPWGDFTVIHSAQDGSVGSSHIQVRLTQIPDSICEDLLKALSGDRFLIHVIEDADDVVNWSTTIRARSLNCRGFANKTKNAIQLIWMSS